MVEANHLLLCKNKEAAPACASLMLVGGAHHINTGDWWDAGHAEPLRRCPAGPLCLPCQAASQPATQASEAFLAEYGPATAPLLHPSSRQLPGSQCQAGCAAPVGQPARARVPLLACWQQPGLLQTWADAAAPCVCAFTLLQTWNKGGIFCWQKRVGTLAGWRASERGRSEPGACCGGPASPPPLAVLLGLLLPKHMLEDDCFNKWLGLPSLHS